MAGPPNKRLRREEYQRAQAAAIIASTNPSSPSNPNGGAHNGTAVPSRGGWGSGKGGKKGAKGGDGGGGAMKIALPKKKFYRQRAHANPFSDHALVYPSDPSEMDWSTHFPHFVASPSFNDDNPKPPAMTKSVEIADIGCGFGGLLVALSPVFPDTLMIGMELRTQVLTYVVSRVAALRHQASTSSDPSPTPAPAPPAYANISALRTNTMKTLPQYFARGSLTKIFICFPDPHFKTRKHKARIVSRALAAEYAYALHPGVGKIYTVTDVEELGRWIAACFDGKRSAGRDDAEQERAAAVAAAEEEIVVSDDDDGDDGEEGEPEAQGVQALFARVPECEYAADPCIRIMTEETEEAKKVTRNGGRKFVGVWTRRHDPDWPSSS